MKDTKITHVSTGLPALDRILQGIRPGDNIVWQMDSINDYVPLIEPLIKNAKNEGSRLVYFRFAKHEELVREDSGAQIYRLCPEAGFEFFISKTDRIIRRL